MNYLSYFKDEKQIQKAISNGFLNIRKKNKLTQEKLAELLDVSVEHISRIENCKYTCSITILLKILIISPLTIISFVFVTPLTINYNYHHICKKTLHLYINHQFQQKVVYQASI